MEYRLDISGYLTKGLEPSNEHGLNIPVSNSVKNIRPTQLGARAILPLTQHPSTAQLSSASVSTSTTSPQLLPLRGETLLLTTTQLWSVATSGACSALTTYAYESSTTPRSPSAGEPWHQADFGDMVFLYNGTDVILKSDWNTSNPYRVYQNGPRTGCNLKHRLIQGGFDNYSWPSAWTTYFDAAASEAGLSMTDPTGSMVWWGQVGGGDSLYLYDSTTILQGPHDSDYSNEYFHTVRNEMGFSPLPLGGTVLKILPLRDFAVVYGDRGLCILRPVTAEGIPTFGWVENIWEGAIDNVGGICAGQDRHLFFDARGDAWFIQQDGQVHYLGYRNVFEDLQSGRIITTYRDSGKLFYITTPSGAYALDVDGRLYETSYFVTGGFGDSEFNATYTTDNSESHGELVTGAFDMNDYDLKEVVGIEVHCSQIDSMRVGLDFDHGNDSYTSTRTVPGSPSGYFKIGASGRRFRVKITGKFSEGSQIDRVFVLFKYLSSRTRRGPRELDLGRLQSI